MFDMFTNLTKAALGVVFSPVSMAADFLTMGGILADRKEPYTFTAFKDAMRNMELAFDPNELNDSKIRQIMNEVNRQIERNRR